MHRPRNHPGFTQVFATGIDPDFQRLSADKNAHLTPKAPVEVYEMAADAPFDEMFTSITPALDALALTKSRVVNFVTKYRDWLPRGVVLLLFRCMFGAPQTACAL